VLELSIRSTPAGDLIGACRDVTREHSQATLRRQKLAADRANQAKSEFMSQVSHELRTPLNAILGFAELMMLDADDPLSAAQRARLLVLRQSGQRLLELIDQLLQIARIEQGKTVLHRRSVHVLTLLQRCVAPLEVLAAQRGIELELDVDETGAGMSVRADPSALEQVVTNLLSNAIKYNRDHGHVLVRLRAGEDGEITVEDTGVGLTDSQLGHLFEPFNRLAADKTGVRGTGLGLVITRKLVQAMGGRLDVWSQLGKGSRFQVHLPLRRRTRARDCHTLPLDLPSRQDSEQHYSVLYIEDDEVNVVLMEQLFATQPAWHLECATTGAAGIAAAVRSRPQLILLDMNLPDMPGMQVLKHLKADPRTRDLSCVAVSADAMPGAVRAALSAGFDDYWTKPLELSSVVGKVKRLLQPERA
jgi:CheY-like chemotaxis protein